MRNFRPDPSRPSKPGILDATGARPGGHLGRRGTLLVLTVVIALATTVITALASIPAGTQFLSGDNFEIDGNKVVNTAGNLDWASTPPPPNLASPTDLTKDTSDNSFGQGSKEDTPVPTVVA